MSITVRVGAVTVTAISDKSHEFRRQWHYPLVSDDAWEPYEDLIGWSDSSALLNFGCFLVRGDDRTVLIDTGWGPTLGPPGAPSSRGALLDELAALGVTTGEVDIVAFTHLHADHVGWNLVTSEGAMSPRFRNARYLVPELDWRHFSARSDLHPNIHQQAIPLADLGVMDLFGDGRRLTPSLHAEGTPGHTPGHTSFVIASGREKMFILGDLIHHPVVAHETAWIHRYDVDGDAAVATRKRVLEGLERDQVLVGAGHLQHPSLGRFRTRNGRRVWEPLSTEQKDA